MSPSSSMMMSPRLMPIRNLKASPDLPEPHPHSMPPGPPGHTNGIQRAAKLDQEAVSGGFDDTSVVLANAGFDEVSLGRKSLRVPSSSRSIIDEKPTTSAARIAASRRVVIRERLPCEVHR